METKHFKYIVILSLCLIIGFYSDSFAATNQRTVTDMAGRTVKIPASVNSVFTDRFTSLLVFAVDSKLLVNATFSVSDQAKKYISSDYYSNKPITDDEDEEILKLRPDIIIIGNLKGQSTIDNANRLQKRLKIPVLVVNFTIEDYIRSFNFLGLALGRKASADKLTAFIGKYLSPIVSKASKLSTSAKPKIYYAEGATGLNTEPSGSIHAQVLDYLSARNVAKTSIGDVHGMAKVSMEQILVWNPDIILVWTGYPSGMGLPGNSSANKSTYSHIVSDPIWAKTNAVKQSKVYQIPSLPFGWFDRPPSSNCIPGAVWLAAKLYPNLVTYNINTAIQEYFSLFYHVDITSDDVNILMKK